MASLLICSVLSELHFHRICQLLDQWISLYPTDFAVSGASGALAALIKSILNKTYLLHYGAEFLPFLEMVHMDVVFISVWDCCKTETRVLLARGPRVQAKFHLLYPRE